MDKIFFAIIFGSIILVGGGIFLSEQKNPPSVQNVPPVGQEISIQGRDHIPEGADHPPYNSEPPSSGPHYAEEADWGIYEEEFPDEQLVHNLEHGGVNIFYKPGTSPEIIEKLKNIQKKYPRKTVLASRSKNQHQIELSSWGRILVMDEFREEQVDQFAFANRNRAPESFPD